MDNTSYKIPSKVEQFLAIFSIGEYYKWNTSQLYDTWKTLNTNYRQITHTNKFVYISYGYFFQVYCPIGAFGIK